MSEKERIASLEADIAALRNFLTLIAEGAEMRLAEWEKDGLPIPQAFSLAERTGKIARRALSSPSPGKRLLDVVRGAERVCGENEGRPLPDKHFDLQWAREMPGCLRRNNP